MQNGLQLNPDKSEALFMGTATQLRAVSSLKSVSVADVDLPWDGKMSMSLMNEWYIIQMSIGDHLTYSSLQADLKVELQFGIRVDRHMALTNFHLDDPSELFHMALL